MNILFCGAGALGSTAATLCRTLPAKLSIVDFDRVESKNLLAQAFTRQAVGKNKAEAMKLQLRTFAAGAGVPSVHAGLAADGTFGLVRWGERFEPDDADEPGQATCVDGEHLPFIGLVAARLATVVARFVRTGERADALVTPA